ncbi:hypothetical protein BJ138DRAFT_1138702 [Hygrophoropsis aurantiaca]|uniref:Uncharacterized protein n=1 Tax=Hygrophoropsis aurantiaca TaxID=72124 RepID=A0ACB7ZRU1_9AGAM|nr:hypothetical protein BJ138DRAFT_1138702 [Hygrophoropsis aurantiaca]
MCALFVGGKDKPTAETLKRIGPVLVKKSIVEKLINFFCTHNRYFSQSGVSYSQKHMDNLFSDEDGQNDVGVLKAVEIAHLDDIDAAGLESSRADYTRRADAVDEQGLDDLIMEAVTYTGGNYAGNREAMKAKALSWALSNNRFILSHDDPALMSYLWPWLDPFGIADQRISLEQQTDSPFATDPTFAFICFNFLQKKEVNNNSCFRVQANLREIGPLEQNPHCKITDDSERRALRVLKKLNAGYKQCRRNEIRSLLKSYGTPAFFITINPSDIRGQPIQPWLDMSSTESLRLLWKGWLSSVIGTLTLKLAGNI